LNTTTGPTVVASPTATTTYTVTATPPAGNCIRTATVTVTVNPLPDATATITPVSCNSNGSITLTPTVGTAPFTATWNTVPVQTGLTATGLAPGEYTVLLRDAKGCERTLTFVVPRSPTAFEAFVQSIRPPRCAGQSNAEVTIGVRNGTAPYTYIWSHNPALNSPTATGLAPGDYTVTVRDANNCEVQVRFNIRAPQPIIIEVDPDRPNTNATCPNTCDGSAAVRVSGGVPPYTFTWSSPDIPSFSYTGTGDPGRILSNLCSGRYKVVVQDANGCRDSLLLDRRSAGVTYTLSQTNVRCHGGRDGSASVSVTSAPNGTSWQWSGPGGFTSPQNATSITNIAAGKYYISFSLPGCSAPIVDSVIITEPPRLVGQATTQDASCRGVTDGRATLSASGGTSASGSYTWVWVSHPQYSGTSVNTLPPDTYAVVVRDDNGCTDTVRFTIGVRSSLRAGISPTTARGCTPLSITWAALPTGTGPFTYAWDMGDGTRRSDSTFSYTYAQAGTYQVVLSIQDATGCRDTARATVTVSPQPRARFEVQPDPTQQHLVGTTFTLTSTSQNATRLTWRVSGLGTHTGASWSFVANEPGEYCISLLAENEGCLDSVQRCVQVVGSSIFIPTAFTPNGDGINDVLKITGQGVVSLRVQVYDRWGNLIFDNNGEATRYWDGTKDGEPAPEGAYVVAVEAVMLPEQKVFKRAVTVTLLR
ncbi:MAG: gliding motility-associated C-terminal domain-containing protein, partial [Bacteroidia bacterium]|nr:gliding motility-associated C-terminal domain-containing protein [Bacteroidia bacterium]